MSLPQRAGESLHATDGAPPPARLGRGVRACEKADLPQVAALYEAIMRSGERTPPPGLARYFERTFFDCPWADPEIPSLVYQARDGRIAGFIGSHVRRLRAGGRILRVACGGQLVVDSAARTTAVGAILFRAHLLGRQDATFTDGANDLVRRMWIVSAGEAAYLKSLNWTRVLRPARYAADYALGRLRQPRLARRLRPVWKPLDRLALKLSRRLRPAVPKTQAEPLSARALLEHLPALTRHLRCHADYDEAFLVWLFREMGEVRSRGTLVRTLVREGGGPVLGWYVYYLHPVLSQVMQVAARPGAEGEVLDHLLHHAYVNGAVAVRGRLEPHLLEALSRRRCAFGWSGAALVHARDPALLGLLMSSGCWLERLDGESWMGHHVEAFS